MVHKEITAQLTTTDTLNSVSFPQKNKRTNETNQIEAGSKVGREQGSKLQGVIRIEKWQHTDKANFCLTKINLSISARSINVKRIRKRFMFENVFFSTKPKPFRVLKPRGVLLSRAAGRQRRVTPQCNGRKPPEIIIIWIQSYNLS